MVGPARRSVLVGAAALAAAGPAAAQGQGSRPARPAAAPTPALVTYEAIRGGTLQLRAFFGRKTALLLDPSRSAERTSIERILDAFDRGWEWYNGFFDVNPSAKYLLQGRVTIAEIANQGLRFGAVGVELLPSSTTLLLNEAARDRYNQSAFYSMGLNYWGCEEQLGKIEPFCYGFADVHRFHCMEAIGITGAPWDVDLDFDHYRHSILIEHFDRYLADRTLNWQNTLGADKAPPNSHGWGAAELAAGFYHRIRRDHGQAGYRRFWKMMLDAPEAKTAKDCASRFVQIARAATGEDYRWMFKDQTLQLVY
jgi:hypothetical protein